MFSFYLKPQHVDSARNLLNTSIMNLKACTVVSTCFNSLPFDSSWHLYGHFSAAGVVCAVQFRFKRLKPRSSRQVTRPSRLDGWFARSYWELLGAKSYSVHDAPKHKFQDIHQTYYEYLSSGNHERASSTIPCPFRWWEPQSGPVSTFDSRSLWRSESWQRPLLTRPKSIGKNFWRFIAIEDVRLLERTGLVSWESLGRCNLECQSWGFLSGDTWFFVLTPFIDLLVMQFWSVRWSFGCGWCGAQGA